MLFGDADLQWWVSMFYSHVCHTTRIEVKVTMIPCLCPQGVMLSME